MLSFSRPFSEALLLFGLFLVFCAIESVPWAWGRAGDVPMGVQVASHALAALDLLIILLIGGRHALSLAGAFVREFQRFRSLF